MAKCVGMQQEKRVVVVELAEDEFAGWASGVRRRLAEQRVGAGSMAADAAAAFADGLVAKLLPEGLRTPGHRVLTVSADAEALGTVWLRVREQEAFVFDVALTAAGRKRGGVLLEAVEAEARRSGASELRVNVFRHDVDTWELLRGQGFAPVSSQLTVIPGTVPSKLELRAMTDAEFAQFLERQEEPADELPDGLATDDQYLFTGLVDGVEVGDLWLEHDGGDQVFVYYVEVRPELRRQGHGKALMEAAASWAFARGAASVRLSVDGSNAPARALYDGLGYRVVEELLRKVIRAG